MKTGNKQAVMSLIDEISRLHKEKESILTPFVISSIPTKIINIALSGDLILLLLL